MPQSTVSLSFTAVSSASVDDQPITNGQVIASTDADGLYYDMNNSRHSAAEIPGKVKLTSDGSKVIRFGTDISGYYGYYKDGESTVTRFREPTGNALPSYVVAGKTFANASSDNLTGTMQTVSTTSFTLAGASTTITQNGVYHFEDEGSGSTTMDYVIYEGAHEITRNPSTVTVNVPITPASTQSKSVTITPSRNTTSGSTMTNYYSFGPDSGYDAFTPAYVRFPKYIEYGKVSVGGDPVSNKLPLKFTKDQYMKSSGYLYLEPSIRLGDASCEDVKSGSIFSSACGFRLTGSGETFDPTQLRLDGRKVSKIYYTDDTTVGQLHNTYGNWYNATPKSWQRYVPSNYRNKLASCRYFPGVGLVATTDWTSSGGGVSIDMVRYRSVYGCIYLLHNSTAVNDTSGTIYIGSGANTLTVTRTAAATVTINAGGTTATISCTSGQRFTMIAIPITPFDIVIMYMWATATNKTTTCRTRRIYGAYTSSSLKWYITAETAFGAARTGRANYATAGTQWHTAYIFSAGAGHETEPYWNVSIHEDAFAYAKNSATPSYYRTCRDLMNTIRATTPTVWALSSTGWKTMINITGENGDAWTRGMIPYIGAYYETADAIGIQYTIHGGLNKDNPLSDAGGSYINKFMMNWGIFSNGYVRLFSHNSLMSIKWTFAANSNTGYAWICLQRTDSTSTGDVLNNITSIKGKSHIRATDLPLNNSYSRFRSFSYSCVGSSSNPTWLCRCTNYSETTGVNYTEIDHMFVYNDVLIVIPHSSTYAYGFIFPDIFNAPSEMTYAGKCLATLVSYDSTTGTQPSSTAIMSLFSKTRKVSAIHGYDIEFAE